MKNKRRSILSGARAQPNLEDVVGMKEESQTSSSSSPENRNEDEKEDNETLMSISYDPILNIYTQRSRPRGPSP